MSTEAQEAPAQTPATESGTPAAAPAAPEPAQETAPATTSDAAPTTDAAPTAPAEAAPVTTPEEPPSPFEWSGEIDNLKSSEWFAGLDDRVQRTLLNGVEDKYKNWQRGYTKSFQENSDRRKTLDAREQEIRDQEARVQKWLYGDVDPLKEKQAEIDRMKSDRESAIKALREEYDANVAKINETHGTEKSDFMDKIQGFERAEVERKAQLAAAEKTAHEQAVVNLEKELNEKAPDVMKNDAAFFAFANIVKVGFSVDDALTMTRAKFPAPEKAAPPKPEEPPASVKLMNMDNGAGGTVSGDSRSYEEMMEKMRRDAMMKNGGIFGQ